MPTTNDAYELMERNAQHRIDYPEFYQRIKDIEKQIREQKDTMQELRMTIIAIMILVFIFAAIQIKNSL